MKISFRLIVIIITVITVTSFACKKNSINTSYIPELTQPAGFTAVASSNKVKLSWTAVGNAAGYKVDLSLNEGFTTVAASSDTVKGTEVVIENLKAKTIYFARLRAISPAGPSGSSKLSSLSFETLVAEVLMAFPGAEGFAGTATGGRGGTIIKVSNLNDAGAGSLRAAVTATGPRIVVFEVSGNIVLKSRLSINKPDITIAGQSAPGDGICIQNHDVTVDADNVIIRFMRFRMGDADQVEGDALGGRFHKNIMIDHCSMSWSTDECVSFYANETFTMQWCLIYESLRNSVHGKGAHGYGGIWGGKNASFHHNLLAHHDSRNPRLGEEAGKAFALTDLTDVRNNLFYNWGPTNGGYGGEAMNVNMVNNYFKPGPATTKRERIFSIDKNKIAGTEVYDMWGKYYINGNFVEGSERATTDNWAYGVFNQFHSSYGTVSEADKTAIKQVAEFNIAGNINTHTPQVAYEKVLTYGGASLKRDACDVRVVDNVRKTTFSFPASNGSGNGIIDTQSDVGGWPLLASTPALKDTDGDGMPDSWETANGLDPASATDRNGLKVSGVYTNIETYLNELVKDIIAGQRK